MPGVEIIVPGPPAPPRPITPERPTYLAVIGRGLRRRCPNCGQGALYRAYLKPIAACAVCRAALGHIRADDAPPYFTILIVGHVVVGLALYAEVEFHPPMWTLMAVFPALALAMTVLLLPVVKGALVGLMWRLNLSGDEVQ